MSDKLRRTVHWSGLLGGLLGAALLMGCGGGEATGGSGASGSGSGGVIMPGGGAGHDSFVNNVYPKLTRCAMCHATGAGNAPIYLGNDAESSYTAIKMKGSIYTFSTDSTLVTKGDHAGQMGLEPEGVDAVRSWLDIEKPPVVDTPGTAPPPTGGVTGFNAAIAEFSKCMRSGDWTELMATYPFIQTEGFGSCSGCHASGNGGTFLNADKDITFKAIRQVPYVYRLVTPVYDGDKITELAPSKRLIDKGLATTNCFDPNLEFCHAPFLVPQDEATNLDTFQRRTLGRVRGLECVEP